MYATSSISTLKKNRRKNVIYQTLSEKTFFLSRESRVVEVSLVISPLSRRPDAQSNPGAEAEKNLTFVTASESVELDASRVPPDGNLSLFFVSSPYYRTFENIPFVMALLYRNNVSQTRVGCFFLGLRFLVDGLI